jgi:FkbM family methyltransferase
MIGKEEKQAVIDLFPFMKDNPTVIDVGSNKGHFADIILEEYGENCNLHLIEPNDKLRSFTEIKYEYKKNIIYYSLPFYKKNTTLSFHYFENFNNELSGIYDMGEYWEGLPKKTKLVQATTVDEYCGMKGIEYIDYLKIDCEGSDMDVLLGAQNMLIDGKIGLVQIEFSELWRKGNHTFIELQNLLRKYGYKIYKYESGNFIEVTEEPPSGNYYITRFDIHNYTGVDTGWAAAFIESTKDLPKLNLVVEIGCYEGMTAKYICDNMLEEGGRVICIDPLMDYYTENDPKHHSYFQNQYQRFKRNTRGLPVELFREKSQDALPKLNSLRCDLSYIDGDHYLPMPYLDACWAFAITKEGGWILFDDYLWSDDTTQSIDMFLEEFAGHYEVVKKEYQVLIKKTMNKYNNVTQSYYL